MGWTRYLLVANIMKFLFGFVLIHSVFKQMMLHVIAVQLTIDVSVMYCGKMLPCKDKECLIIS